MEENLRAKAAGPGCGQGKHNIAADSGWNRDRKVDRH
jgi:hypothetical protein